MSTERGQQNWPFRAEEAAEGAGFLRRWGKRWDRGCRDSRSYPTFSGDRECIPSRNRPDRPGVQVTRPRGRGWGVGRKTHTEMEAVSASPTQPVPGAPASSSPLFQAARLLLSRWEMGRFFSGKTDQPKRKGFHSY